MKDEAAAASGRPAVEMPATPRTVLATKDARPALPVIAKVAAAA
jgi:hypothetical protein